MSRNYRIFAEENQRHSGHFIGGSHHTTNLSPDPVDVGLYGDDASNDVHARYDRPASAVSHSSFYPQHSMKSPDIQPQYSVPPRLSNQQMSVKARHCNRYSLEHQDDDKLNLKLKMDRFVAQNKDIINAHDSEPIPTRDRQIKMFNEDDFMPPLDSMMLLKSSRLQRDRFFDEVEVGDVFCCSVVAVTDSGLDMVLLCYACKRNREIDQLKVVAYCSSRDVPELLYGQSKEVSDVYSVKDKVLGVVIGLSQHSEKIQISLLNRDLPRSLEDKIKLGVIRSEELPAAYKTMCLSEDLTYRQILLSNPVFSGPGATTRLCKRLAIHDDLGSCSLLSTVTSVEINGNEMATALRKQQTRIHALHSVMAGVKLYKEGKHTEALSQYNKALDIDVDNVEALVARGAMYANNESYQRALEDFKHALKVDANHGNAKDYTVQTLLAYARDLSDADDVDSAVKYYNEALSLDPDNTSARQALTQLVGAQVDQEPTVSSTRCDSTSPAYMRFSNSRRSRESSRPSRNSTEDSGSKRRGDESLERRRSLMSDGRKPDRRYSSPKMTHNEERRVRSDLSNGSSSDSDSSTSNKRPRSRTQRSSSNNSSHNRRNSTVKVKENYHSSYDRSRGRDSDDERYSDGRRSPYDSRKRGHSHSSSSGQRESKHRRRRSYSSSSSSRSSSRRSASRRSDRSASRSPRKRSTDQARPSNRHHSFSSRGVSQQYYKSKETRLEPTEVDRYAARESGSSSIDMFREVTHGTILTSAPAHKTTTSTSFLPYCLSTDPSAVKKSIIKPINVKKPADEKTFANFMVQAQRGKRKAIIDSASTSDSKKAVDSDYQSDKQLKITGSSSVTKSESSHHSISHKSSRLRKRSRSASRSRSRSASGSRSYQKSSRHSSSSRSRDVKSRSKNHGRNRENKQHKKHKDSRTSSSYKKSRHRSKSNSPTDYRAGRKSESKIVFQPSKITPHKITPDRPALLRATGSSGGKRLCQLSLKLAADHIQKGTKEENKKAEKRNIAGNARDSTVKDDSKKKVKLKKSNDLKQKEEQDKLAKVDQQAKEQKLQQMEEFLTMLKTKNKDK